MHDCTVHPGGSKSPYNNCLGGMKLQMHYIHLPDTFTLGTDRLLHILYLKTHDSYMIGNSFDSHVQ